MTKTTECYYCGIDCEGDPEGYLDPVHKHWFHYDCFIERYRENDGDTDPIYIQVPDPEC